MFDPQHRRESDEIEFDFFDDAPTREATERELRGDGPPRRRRLPRRPTGRGGPPPRQLRLAGLVAGIVALVVILIVVVSSCQGNERDAYAKYMGDVANITGASDRIGTQLKRAIATPGTKLPDLQGKLDGYRGQQAQLVAQAQALDPPGTLREEQESLVEAMQLRVSGLAGLAQGLQTGAENGGARATGAALADQAKRFVASDVVYADLFRGRAVAVMREKGVTGVDVPSSSFLSTPELAQASTWTLLVKRLTAAPSKGGLHGNQIESVYVLPGRKKLAPTEENTIATSDQTAFEVVVRNSGDSIETGVQVNFTIAQDPQIKGSKTIDLIEPGKTKRVVFSLDQGPPVKFTTPTTLRVNVLPVPGEQNTGNNSAEYRVVFSFG